MTEHSETLDDRMDRTELLTTNDDRIVASAETFVGRATIDSPRTEDVEIEVVEGYAYDGMGAGVHLRINTDDHSTSVIMDPDIAAELGELLASSDDGT